MCVCAVHENDAPSDPIKENLDFIYAWQLTSPEMCHNVCREELESSSLKLEEKTKVEWLFS